MPASCSARSTSCCPPVITSQQSLQAHYAARRALPTYASWLTISDDDCINIDPHPQPPDDPDQPTPPIPVSDGPVVDCRIVNNRILDMGASGITVAFWFDPDREGDAIVTDRLRIDGNEIRGCMRLNLVILPPELREIVAFGGITLAAGADIAIRDNRIFEVGTEHTTPIVGIFVLDGEAVAIQRNHARDNGRIADLESDIEIGWAGGIIVALARPAVDFFAPLRGPGAGPAGRRAGADRRGKRGGGARRTRALRDRGRADGDPRQPADRSWQQHAQPDSRSPGAIARPLQRHAPWP